MDRTEAHDARLVGSMATKENPSSNEKVTPQDAPRSRVDSALHVKFGELKKSIPMFELLLAYLRSLEATDHAPRQEMLVKKVKNILTKLNSEEPSEKCDLSTLECIENVVESVTSRMAPKLKDFEKQRSLANQKNRSALAPSTPPSRKESPGNIVLESKLPAPPQTVDTIDLTVTPTKSPVQPVTSFPPTKLPVQSEMTFLPM